MDADTLRNRIESVYSSSHLPPRHDKELELTENQQCREILALYTSIAGRAWSDIGEETIEAESPDFFHLSDALLSYYLPSILKLLVTNDDASTLKRLIRRVLPKSDAYADFEWASFCQTFELDNEREQLFTDVLVWAEERGFYQLDGEEIGILARYYHERWYSD